MNRAKGTIPLKREHIAKWFERQNTSPPKAAVLLREFREFVFVEDGFLLRPQYARDIAQSWAEKTFGVTAHEARFGFVEDDWVYEDYFPTVDEKGTRVPDAHEDVADAKANGYHLRAEIKAHQRKLETLHVDDLAAVAILDRWGLDMRGENGQPLRAAHSIRLQAECAAKGIFGQLPTRSDIDSERWADWLQEESEDFMRRRRRS